MSKTPPVMITFNSCFVKDTVIWQTHGYEGYLDPPCNLIQEKISDLLSLKLPVSPNWTYRYFLSLNDVSLPARQLELAKNLTEQKVYVISVTLALNQVRNINVYNDRYKT